jgi:sugar phosphate isomerase/epimerase
MKIAKTKRELALEAFAKRYDEWEANPNRMDSGYEYEKTFVEMMESLGTEVLTISTGRVPKSKNEKKKSHN